MDPCKEKEPRVINNALIEKCILEQGPKGEAGRLARTEGVPFDKVEQIRFEFLNILRIDHVWVLPALTKLGLNNNMIENIENLETLVNLKELDLSFNKISKIENLDTLVNLEKLNLYDNLIAKIENLNKQTKLSIFSIGKNYIDDLESVLYLRKLRGLRSLNMEGNPVAETENFRIYVAVFLPQLVYYEYKLIQPFEKEQGDELYGKQLMSLEEVESKQREQEEYEEKIKADAEMHSVSFVEYLNSDHLFLAMYELDTEGIAFLEMGEEIQEIYNDYKEQYVNICQQIFELGQEEHTNRQAEIDQFEKCVGLAQKDNQDMSIQFMEEFTAKKAKRFSQIRYLQEKVDENEITIKQYEDQLESIAAKFDNHILELWRQLMKLELELVEQMEDINQTFEHTLAELVNHFVETAQGFFSQVRALEVNYSEQVSECAGRYATNANLTEGFQIPPALKPIMSDKEALANAVSASHDLHLQIIDGREDTLVNRAKQWFTTLIDDLQKNEINRNRSKVLEINHFLDIQKEEFLDASVQTTQTIDPEVTAVLY